MLGRKTAIQCSGILLFALASISTGFAYEGEKPGSKKDNKTVKNDSLLADKNKGKKETAVIKDSATVDAGNGVTITTSGNRSYDELANDEVFVEETKVRREFVLEEDFKLWRIYVQKGRKTTEYRKVEVPYGVYFKKNSMDITEEFYNHETKDLPEGEVKRFKRDEYEAKERERIAKEIMEHFQIREIPMDSLNVPAPVDTSGNR